MIQKLFTTMLFAAATTTAVAHVSFQSGNVTIKCNNIVFQGGSSVELGTELNVETR